LRGLCAIDGRRTQTAGEYHPLPCGLDVDCSIPDDTADIPDKEMEMLKERMENADETLYIEEVAEDLGIDLED
jgi:hypothetical protein